MMDLESIISIVVPVVIAGYVISVVFEKTGLNQRVGNMNFVRKTYKGTNLKIEPLDNIVYYLMRENCLAGKNNMVGKRLYMNENHSLISYLGKIKGIYRDKRITSFYVRTGIIRRKIFLADMDTGLLTQDIILPGDACEHYNVRTVFVTREGREDIDSFWCFKFYKRYADYVKCHNSQIGGSYNIIKSQMVDMAEALQQKEIKESFKGGDPNSERQEDPAS